MADCIGESEGSSDGERFPRARAAIRQAAVEGRLVITGKKQMLEGWSSTVFSDAATTIPPEYWKAHELTPTAAGESNLERNSAHTELKPALRRPSGNNYSGLEVDWNQVARLWPMADAKGEHAVDRME